MLPLAPAADCGEASASGVLAESAKACMMGALDLGDIVSRQWQRPVPLEHWGWVGGWGGGGRRGYLRGWLGQRMSRSLFAAVPLR